MNDFWLFLYTPLPWLAAMYAAAYRRDLARVLRPFRDHAHLTEWWSVCMSLGLIKSNIKRPAENRWEPRTFFAVLASASISLLWLVIPMAFAWYHLCALQACSALPLFLILHRRLGPLPYKPYRDFLLYPRLGTRIRHLKNGRKWSAVFSSDPAQLPD